MRRARLFPAVFVAVALIAGGVLADEVGRLEIASDETEIAGEFRIQGKIVLEFSSRQESPTSTDIEIRFRGALFDGRYDSDTGVLRIQGFGAKVLPDERAFAERTHDELVRRMGDADPADRRHFLLERMLLLLSDAPAGFVWDELEIEVDDP